MRKTLIKWLLLTLLIAYSAAVTVWAHGEAAKLSCKGITVNILEGASADSVTRQGIIAELSRMNYKIVGTPLQQLDSYKIEKFLSSFSNFESVYCAITSEGMLEITIQPMVPELRVFTPTESYYINKEGKKIPSNAHFFVDTPVATGDFNQTFTPKDVLPISRFVNNDAEMHDLVSMIVARDANNIFLVPRIAGHIINFGDTTRLLEKKRALFTMYHKVIPYKGWEEYDTISVKFKGQIVATRRNKTLPDHGALVDEEEDPEEATLPDDPI